MPDVEINERATVKRLVAVGYDEVWYELSAGTLIELNTYSGAIDTSDNLNMFEAFQKVFVVNGTNLKVADFVNTKLTLAEFTTAPTRGSTVTQAGSTATMIVDFVNTGLTEIYGYVTSGTFTTIAGQTLSGGGLASGNSLVPTGIAGMLTHVALATAHAATDTLTQADTDVAWATGIDYIVGDVILYSTVEYICIVAHTSDVGGGDGSGGTPDGNPTEWTATVTATMVVEYTDASKTHTWGRITAGIFDTDNLVSGDDAGTAFTPTATDISPPVWYDWTPYAGGASGTMPTKAYLGCLYRGRNVLAGNPNYPHQWYMSKTGNPWDWVYTSTTDPLGATAGNSADAGETGDIIRALISYKDDYLIFGCASTIWVLTGDPAQGGKIDEVDLTVGIYGANSWCFDGDGNLYFWGTGGIYKTPLGFRSIENLTEISLPDLISDEGADPSSHRITMAYDRKRHGILICITKLSDGDNSNYFYDLKLKGFFPEDYPDECGPYSLFYYAANDPDYTDLLLGCKDGYIRKFDPDAQDDNTGSGATDPIESYVVWPIQHLTEDNDKEGKLTSLTIELAGGGADGAFGDTDGVSYDIYVADDAETLIENIKDVADTPFTTGTLSGTGRKARIRTKVRGAWLGIKFYNSTAAETWAVNKIFGEVKEAGKIR